MTLTIWSQYPIAEEFYPLFDTVASVTDDLAQANAVLAGGSEPYDGDFMDSAPKLAVISRTGIGYNNVDVSAATSRGIAVCNAPDAPTMSTAEHTIGLIFGVAKQLKWCEERLTHDAAMGDFKGSYQGLELYGQTLGLVGFGRIGRRVGEMATGIGMKVIAFDPFVEPLVMIDARVSPVESLEILLSRSDVVSLHLPLLPETSKLMNAERFAMMKPGAIFINASRGGLLVEEDLIEALDSGHLYGAGIDVYEVEPPVSNHPFLGRTDIVATPHIASGTTVGRKRLWRDAIHNVVQIFKGQRPAHLLNPSVWPLNLSD